MTSDILDDVLNLEEQYYREGYENGYRDGAEAGRVEGRSVGLKQGYERFLEAGRLQGRALVWANRIPRLRGPSPGDGPAPAPGTARTPPSSSSSLTGGAPETAASGGGGEDPRSRRLPDLASGGGVGNRARLEKNIVALYGMVEPGTLPTRNDDEAVNDFDGRLRGAQGKAKIIERAVGEKTKLDAPDAVPAAAGPKNENIEDVGRIRTALMAAGTTGPPE